MVIDGKTYGELAAAEQLDDRYDSTPVWVSFDEDGAITTIEGNNDLATEAEVSAVGTDINNHTADTTNVHGIPDTANLLSIETPEAHIADPTGGTTVDTQARSAIVSILNTLETFGLSDVA